MRPRHFAVATSLVAIACASRPPAPAFLVPGAAGSAAVAQALAAAPLGPTENIRAQPLITGEEASASVVQVRDRERPHVHTRYDITVLLAKGHGTLWLDGIARPMRAGDGVFIPKGTPHWFVNEGE